MTLIRESCLIELKARANLGEVVSRIVTLKGRGDNLVGLCPFHGEKTPSFHVHPERGFFKCFGCGMSGDAVDFVRETEQLDFTAAVEALGARFNVVIEYEDGTHGTGSAAGGIIRRPPPKPIETRQPSESWLRVQRGMKPGTFAELTALAAVRRFPSLAGLELATRAGHLWFSELRDDDFWCPCWLLTDGSRHNAQARKLDGSMFRSIGDKKSKTMPGCEANWPVGISEVGSKPDIFMVEGGPDFLAAWHWIWLAGRIATTAPVAMFGVSNPIHGAALPLFRDKNVRIYPHNDADFKGLNGAIRWRSQLLEAGAKAVDFFDFRPEGNKDLNDLITQYGIPQLREVV